MNDDTTSDFPSAVFLNQLHVDNFNEIDVKALDPSLAIGFYFRTREEFTEFIEQTKKEIAIKASKGITPLFHIEHSPPAEYGVSDDDEDDTIDHKNGDCDDDDYVFI